MRNKNKQKSKKQKKKSTWNRFFNAFSVAEGLPDLLCGTTATVGYNIEIKIQINFFLQKLKKN